MEVNDEILEYNRKNNNSVVLIEKKLKNEYGLDSQDIGLGLPKLEDLEVIIKSEILEGPITIPQKRTSAVFSA